MNNKKGVTSTDNYTPRPDYAAQTFNRWLAQAIRQGDHKLARYLLARLILKGGK